MLTMATNVVENDCLEWITGQYQTDGLISRCGVRRENHANTRRCLHTYPASANPASGVEGDRGNHSPAGSQSKLVHMAQPDIQNSDTECRVLYRQLSKHYVATHRVQNRALVTAITALHGRRWK